MESFLDADGRGGLYGKSVSQFELGKKKGPHSYGIGKSV
jgi:hypothetical protein